MFPELQFFGEGVPLYNYGLTQNDQGVYYWNGSYYATPKVDEFDNANPDGFTKYFNGSHATSYINGAYGALQLALDIPVSRNLDLSCNQDLYVENLSGDFGSFIKLSYKNLHIYLVHTYLWTRAIGQVIPANTAICAVIPYYGHVHFYCVLDGDVQFSSRDIILNGKITLPVEEVTEQECQNRLAAQKDQLTAAFTTQMKVLQDQINTLKAQVVDTTTLNTKINELQTSNDTLSKKINTQAEQLTTNEKTIADLKKKNVDALTWQELLTALLDKLFKRKAG